MRLIVTRPQAEAEATAARLRDAGCDTLVAPVMAPEFVDAPAPQGPFDAVIATSAQAAQALQRLAWRAAVTALPAFAPGAHSAAALRAAGFATVQSAEGDAAALAALAGRRPAAHFLYLAGADRAFDLASALEGRGHRVTTVVLYRMARVAALPPQAGGALAVPGGTAVLHYSARSAAAFFALCASAGLADAAAACLHLCLSARVAETVREAGGCSVRIAERPDEAAMIALAQELCPPDVL